MSQITGSVLVALPFYNAAPYLGQAIASMLSQTYRDFTLLAVDDGSTDESASIVQQFDDPRIILKVGTHGGPCVARNAAIEFARAEGFTFVALMDSDDVSLSRRLELQTSYLEAHRELAACSANAYYIDHESGARIGTSLVSASPAVVRWEIRHGLRGLIQGTSVFRTNALVEIGGYRSIFAKANDTDIFLRLSERYPLGNVPTFLYEIRLRTGSLSMADVPRTVEYHFYALDCASRRRRGARERSLEAFVSRRDWRVRLLMWRERTMLGLWRSGMRRKAIWPVMLAAILDPRRLLARLLHHVQKRAGV